MHNENLMLPMHRKLSNNAMLHTVDWLCAVVFTVWIWEGLTNDVELTKARHNG